MLNGQGHDTVLDFDQAGGDRIDVRTIAFTGPLIVTEAADAGHYVVAGDTNGDGVEDFHLDVYGASIALTQEAFIFA